PMEGANPADGVPGTRCAFATQPKPQSCDADNPRDDDCDGSNVTGTKIPLAMLGVPCGVNRGEGTTGMVVGCDLSQPGQFGNVYAKFGVEVLTAPYNPAERGYVCSGGKVPSGEVCDGRDNDCKAGPDPAEKDGDNDKYLSCGALPCGTNLATGLLGC